jgi:hypothetical protein
VAGVYLSEAQNPIPPPLYTLYDCTCIQYTQKEKRRGYTVKNAVELLGAFRPDVEKIQYH